jgi:hypothetical protein
MAFCRFHATFAPAKGPEKPEIREKVLPALFTWDITLAYDQAK